MTAEAVGMMAAGIATLGAGLVLVRRRFRAAVGVERVLVLAPVFEATAFAIFGAEHLLAAHDLMGAVPRWIPGPLFWTYFVGVAWIAAAISLIAWRYVRWSASLIALALLIIVATIDLPNLPRHLHERLFWTLTARETAFAAGAMVLAGSMWPRGRSAGTALVGIGRTTVALVSIFYAIEHFLFPLFVPGVPLEKHIPPWWPAPALLSYIVGLILLLGGIGLLTRPAIRIAAAASGAMLVILTACFYLPILLMELHTSLVVEGINYVGDTLLFAATVLLAGYAADKSWPGRDEVPAARSAALEQASFR